MTKDAGPQIPPQTGNLVPQGNAIELRVGTIRTVQHREKPASDYPEVVVGQETLIWSGTDWVEVRKLVAKADAADRVRKLVRFWDLAETPAAVMEVEIRLALDGRPS